MLNEPVAVPTVTPARSDQQIADLHKRIGAWILGDYP